MYGACSPVYALSRAVSESWKLFFLGEMRLVNKVVQNVNIVVRPFYEGPVVTHPSYRMISIMATAEVLDLLPSQQATL
jgi:hypothetical protein